MAFGKSRLAASMGFAALLACLCALSAAPEEAQAAVPGENGRIAYASGEYYGIGEIFSVDPNGTGEKRLTNDPGSDSPGFSPDGAKIAYSSFTGPSGDRGDDTEIWVMDRSGGGKRALTNNGSDIDEEYPDWSPDGKKIAYTRLEWTRNPDGSLGEYRWDIWTMNPDGSGKRQLTDDVGYEVQATYSPDGTKIAYQHTGDIWVMNADGSGQRNLTDTPLKGESDPDFSPDGEKLAFGDGDVYTVNLDGSALTNVTNSRYRVEYHPSWSPNGTRLAYEKSFSEDTEIFTKAADGTGTAKNVSKDPERDDHSPDWGPRRSG